MSTRAGPVTQERGGFWHEAWPYTGDVEFVDRAASFVDEGVCRGEAVLVVVDGGKIEKLRAAMGGDVPGVAYADMSDVGHNPARIIPVWRRFLDAHDTARRARDRRADPLGTIGRRARRVSRARDVAEPCVRGLKARLLVAMPV